MCDVRPTHLSEDNLKAFGLAGPLLSPLPGLAGHQCDVVTLGGGTPRQNARVKKCFLMRLDWVVAATTGGPGEGKTVTYDDLDVCVV